MVRFSASVLLLLLVTPAWAQQPMLLSFSIPGCAPCRQMAPAVAQLQREGFPVRKVDGSREPHLASRFRVDRYPTTVVVAGRREVRRATGPQSYQALRQMLAAVAVQPAAAQAPLVRPAGQRSRVAPATFAAATQEPASFQVGNDLGPAPEVTIPGATPPAAPYPASPSQPAAGAAGAGPEAARLLSVSVRLKVKDRTGSSFGTGTIIDARSGEALVLTCGHLFRDAAGGHSPTIVAELFRVTASGLEVAERAPGQVISYDLERDVALVSIRPRTPPMVAKVASSRAATAVGGVVWSVGCDRGADPTVRAGRVTTVDRYQSPPSLTATGAPVVGRSGGGLFNERGELVGVCFGADAKADEGFYARLASIHAELDKLGLTAIYRGGATSESAAGIAAAPARAPGIAEGLVPVSPRSGELPVVRGQDSFAQASPLPTVSPAERAALEELSRRAAESEVVCVIRPKDPGGKSEVITLDRVSPQFLQALDAMRGTARQ